MCRCIKRVWHHGAEQHAGEDPRVKDVHTSNVSSDTESSELRKTHKSRRTNCKTFPNFRRGVLCCVKYVSTFSDPLIKLRHLSDAARVDRDGAEGIDGQSHCQCAKHTQGSQCHPENATQIVSNKDRNAKTLTTGMIIDKYPKAKP